MRRKNNEPWKHPTIKNFWLRPITIRAKRWWKVMTPKPGGGGNPKVYRTWAEADTARELAETRIKNDGLNGLVLTSRQLQQAKEAFEKLKAYPELALIEAVNFYIQQHENLQQSVTVREASARLLETKMLDGRRPRTTKTLRNILDRFALRFGDRKIAEVAIKGAEIDDWLRDLGVASGTRRTHWLRLHLLFQFSQTRGWSADNPMGKVVEKPKATGTEPGILTPKQFARLLEVASIETLPYWLLGGLAGLRSQEIQRLEWNDLDFDAGLITVIPSKSKTASKRHVTMQPALKAWLKPYQNRNGHICPRNLRVYLEADRERAGIKTWPNNGLRHSYASYHLAHFQNAAQLALEMGHKDQDMVFNHYRQLVKPAAASAWWSILPQLEPNIVAMTA